MIICLKNLAQNHSIAILTSIHQPNSDIFGLFDQLYVLNSRGQCIYNGNLSKIKDHLVKCEFPLMDNHDPIKELIKVVSCDSNSIFDNELVETFDNELVEKFEDGICSEEPQMKDCKLLKKIPAKNKSFNFFDVIILLRRTARDKLIGEWKIEFGFLICYLLSIILILYLFPNDIGTDPGCTEERIDLTNISLINERILSVITGNEQKFQKNIKFIFIIILIISSFNIIQLAYMFSYDNQVSIILIKKINFLDS